MVKRKRYSAPSTLQALFRSKRNVQARTRRSFGKRAGITKLALKKLTAEPGYFDTTIANGISDTGSLFPLNNMAQGSDINQRVGRKVDMVSVSCNLQWLQSDASNRLRLLLVYDKMNSGSTPAFSDVMVTQGGSSNIFSHPNVANLERFVILYDQLRSVQAPGTAYPTTPQEWNVKWSRSLKGKETVFNSSGTNFEKGGLYLMAISDSAAVAHPSIYGTLRVKYFD